jgi:hypothetical protein
MFLRNVGLNLQHYLMPKSWKLQSQQFLPYQLTVVWKLIEGHLYLLTIRETELCEAFIIDKWNFQDGGVIDLYLLQNAM